MSALLKKIIVSLLVFVVLFTSVAPNFFLVKAQDQSNLSAPAEGSWYNQGFDQWYNKVYDENTSPGNEIFGERYTAAQVQWVIYSLFAFVINGSLSNSTVSQKAVACIFTNVTNIETCSGALKDLLEGCLHKKRNFGSLDLHFQMPGPRNKQPIHQKIFSQTQP